MSGYGGDSHENKNNIFGNDYVNFDQFLMQHNFGGNSSQYYNNAPTNAMNYSYTTPYGNPSNGTHEQNLNAYNPYNDFYQPQSNCDFNPNLVQNSNLMATANAFVPNFAPMTSSIPAPETSPLMANAMEFVPRNAVFNEHANIPSTSTDGGHKFGSIVSSSNNRQKVPSDQDALMNAFRKTHMDDSLTAATLTSAGGAIKKVKNGNSREGKFILWTSQKKKIE